ncbi:DUF4031 domain-containing protein [Paraburkholderia humisilvae]|uniref:DUF4031 domain-containing protein n=1 Tax=Paraburkholderia humisilvae TaxID=627669 RepID=A0A6J5DKN2_9BURK|nr:DUF4031 domain-containing protein [Paraburkholderia humisilvae]CAB3754523.1 hypothetical protein LMG29542_02374 [Paraburkholderia humisilvae]
MAVYVDDAGIVWKGKLRFHMTADSLDELHAFAQAVGINRCWYHTGARHPHYDVIEAQRAAAIANGAIAVTQRELMRVARRIARNAVSDIFT